MVRTTAIQILDGITSSDAIGGENQMAKSFTLGLSVDHQVVPDNLINLYSDWRR